MKRLQLIFAVVLSLLVVVFVLLQMDWHQVWMTIKGISLGWLLAAVISHLLTYALRTGRFQYLLGGSRKFFRLLGTTNLYGMYLYLMPVKTGEVTFPLLYKEHLSIPLARSTAALVAARVMDLIVMALLLPILLATQWSRLGSNLGIVIAGVSLLVLLGFGLLLWLLYRPAKLEQLLKKTRQSKVTLMRRLGKAGSRLFQELRIAFSQKKLLISLLISIAIWFLVQTTLYAIITSLGFPVTLMQVYVVTLILIPVTLIPVQGFANLGSHEISFVAAFSLFGFDSMTSMSIAVGSHIIYIGLSLLLGLTGIILLQLFSFARQEL